MKAGSEGLQLTVEHKLAPSSRIREVVTKQICSRRALRDVVHVMPTSFRLSDK
jgi:hypothetical protein